MRETPAWLPWLVGFGLLMFASELFNIWQIDRLEARLLEIEASGGRAPTVVRAAAPAAERVPGKGSGVTAVGWGGASAEILFVEGAVPDAPLTLDEKPRPQGDTYVNRRASAASKLNIFNTNEGETRTICRDLLDTLMRSTIEDPSEVEGALAISWEVSEDKLTYTFHLRRGVLFADGRPFTSKDVKFSFDTMRDPAVKADILRSNFEDVESLETPDDHTVVVRYRKPDWRGLYAVGTGLFVLNSGWFEQEIPKYAEELGKTTFSTKPGTPGFGEVFNEILVPGPGTGPYVFSDRNYDKSKGVTLDKNPFYWGIQVKPTWFNFDHLKWIYISDEVAAFEAFRKGEFDVSVVDHSLWDDQLQHDETMTSIASHLEYDHMGLGFNYIAWNNRQPPFDDPRVRKAMTHLVDRDFLLKEVERGRGQIAVAFGKPIYPEYAQDLTPWPYDPAAAGKLLAEAGWKDTNGDGVLDKGGKRFEFEFKYPSGSRPIYEQLAELLRDAGSKVGIRVTKRPLEWSTFVGDIESRNYDAISLYASFADPWIDPSGFHSSGDVPNGPNTPGWRNPEADRIIDEFKTEFDRSKRVALFQQFHQLWHEEQPMTLLMHSLVGVVQSKRFEDVTLTKSGLRPNAYWVKPENVKYK